ncbi:peptidoglycan DD-metalloendopeptidase family protein [Desulfobacterales bacterium HSG2]|nr:peptidoglycan DD-metalloendopeptidase family protein [Desulfobacterales bacterium HSG2]
MKFPLKKSGFSEHFLKCNHLYEAGFEEWLFHPGMLFDSLEKWWGDGGERPGSHEGIDLCLYRNNAGQISGLNETTRIPATHDGRVIKTDDDFLGKSVYLAHEIYDGNRRQLYTIYGHTAPYRNIHAGTVLNEGELIGTIADVKKKKVKILPHLHITIAWIPATYPPEKLNWETLGKRRDLTLLDPLEIISCKYAISTLPEVYLT